MKKISLQKVFWYILIIVCICILKGTYIHAVGGDNYNTFVQNVLVFWDDNQLVNLIWFLPILLSLYLIAKNYFYSMNHFDMRFKNRKRFIYSAIINCITASILFNFLIAVFQVIVLSIVSKTSIIINVAIISFILQYVIENTFLSIIIVLFAMFIKNFMYTYILFVIFIITNLSVIINLSLIKKSIYIPFINLYYNDKLNLVTILLTIISIFLIKRLYLRYDIGGME